MKFVLSCAAGLTIIALLWASNVTFSGDHSPQDADQSKAPVSLATRKADKVIGRHVPNFILSDFTGKQIALADFNDARLIVLVFLGTRCPIGNAYVPDLVDLQNRYRDRKVQVIGINSNLSDTVEDIARHANAFKINFPMLIDDQQLVADLVSSQRISETRILDRRHTIRYKGRIDDRVGYNFRHEKAHRSELEEALNELLAGMTVSVAETESQGCLITRRANLRGAGEVTYAKHVAPILQNRCLDCHHPGTATPFSLLTYEEARDWSAMMKETVVQRRMPPWNADARYGHFSNDLRLKQEEIDTLEAWVDRGAPFGDKKDLPEPRQFSEGWLIPQPDIVFKMPLKYTVKATGAVDYQYFVTPTNFEKDVWVQAAEARPGNRAAVHHIIAFIRDQGSNETQNLPYVCGYAPGEEPTIFPNGIGLKIPAQSEIVWQVHYTPTGKEEADCSELALILCRERPSRPVQGGSALNMTFSIPPGDANHRVVSSSQISNDIELLSLVPHMHLRGKDFRYTAHYPDGRQEVLLSIPDFDFNWQHLYRFTKPFPIPKGTTIECIAHFDNSAENPANPDPAVTVRWGDQTWEEMMIGWYVSVDAINGDVPPKDPKTAP